MKKIVFISLILSLSALVFGQSITISPTATDEVSVQSYGILGAGSFYGKNADGNSASPKATLSNTAITILGARGYNGALYPSASQGLIGIYSSQDFKATGLGTHIRFETTAINTTNRLERMRINHNGYIGIGTTAPLATLHVQSYPSGATPYISDMIIENLKGPIINLLSSSDYYDSGLIWGNRSGIAKGRLLYSSSNTMSFATDDVIRVTISGNGNVGVGTTSPNAKLEVAGTFAISGKTTMTGNQNNFNLNGKSVIKVSGGSTYTLTGIAGGADGMIVHIMVTSSTDLILAEDSPSSSLGNRIVTGSNANITIGEGGGATLIYDGDTNYWRVIGVKI